MVSFLNSAKTKKEGGRKQAVPKSRITILPSASVMKLPVFMSAGQRRKPCSTTSDSKLTCRSLLSKYFKICVKGYHRESARCKRDKAKDKGNEHLRRLYASRALCRIRTVWRQTSR